VVVFAPAEVGIERSGELVKKRIFLLEISAFAFHQGGIVDWVFFKDVSICHSVGMWVVEVHGVLSCRETTACVL